MEAKVVCSSCGQEIDRGEVHDHLPDIFLNVWDCQYCLARTRIYKNGGSRTETLPFSITETWAEWILETCGGAINMSGMYRLPGMVWEWSVAKLRGDEKAAGFIGKRIDEYVREGGDRK